MNWKIGLFYKILKYEVKNAKFQNRIKRAWVRMLNDDKEFDRVRAMRDDLFRD